MTDLITIFLIILGIQVAFFLFAALLKTDKVTDLSYGLTFVFIAIYVAIQKNYLVAWLLAIIITLWGLRLSTYLFIRILTTKTDKRFDGIRERFWSFAGFWTLQAITIFVILLPILLQKETALGPLHYSGIFIWLLGFVIEFIADQQKFQFKKNNPNHWVDVGLWKYARHPNYFGEMLCWWGVFVFAASSLTGWGWIAIISPLFISFLLFFVSGIPPLERQHDKKYGANRDYQEWKNGTRLLVPFPK